MIIAENNKDMIALRHALYALEQIALRSTDKSSRALADVTAADLRARIDARAFS